MKDFDITEGADFIKKFEDVGIILEKFKFENQEYRITKIIEYRSIGNGLGNNGKNQVGLYRIKTDKIENIALIHDYSYGDSWRIKLINKTKTEEEMKNWLFDQDDYKMIFSRYILSE